MAKFFQDKGTGPVWYARDHQNVPLPPAWGLGINASEELKGLNPKNRFYDSAISNGVWANVSVDTIMHPDVHSFYGNESSGILG